MEGELRQSVYSRLGGYEDINDAEGLRKDPRGEDPYADMIRLWGEDVKQGAVAIIEEMLAKKKEAIGSLEEVLRLARGARDR